MTIEIYRFLTFIFYPLIYLFIQFRKNKGKEDKNRYKERFAKTNIKRPDGKLVWINAVSVGEINSAWTIIKKINENNENNILITTTSVTSAENVNKKLEKLPNPSKVIHQFVPIDCCMKKFLEHWQPNLLINVESEFWPNLFTLTKKYCKIIVLNGKMSKKSFRFWYIQKKLKETIFDSIDICLAQSRNDYKRFINLGVQNVQYLGNIKFFVDKCDVNTDLYNKFFDKIKDRKKWLVNCTHKGEESIIIEVHKKLKQKYKDLFTTLIIRHPNRSQEICELLKQNNINFVKATDENFNIGENVEFYLHDRIGDIGTFFELNDIVFIGGSLVKNIGGHNPAEAIKQNCCVITGPYIESNYNLYKELSNAEACIILKDNKINTIVETIQKTFDNNQYKQNIIDNSYKKSIGNNSILNEIMKIINNYIND